MKITDFEQVRFLMTVKGDLEIALRQVRDRIQQVDSSKPEKSYKGFEKGHTCYLHSRRDGSGPEVNMRGCYVEQEMLEATQNVLTKKLSQTLETLNNLGVEL